MSKTRPARSQGKKTLTMAFIGAGGIANAHLSALKNFVDVRVIGLSDVAMPPMEEKADEYGIPRENLFTDYKKMLRKLKPDAVNVCTPNGLHAPASIAALKAGAHVIVEKPMALNAKEAKAMIAAAKAAKKKLCIGFQYRFDPKTVFLKRLVDDGVMGDIRFGRVQALRRRGIPNWGVFGRKELQGGGPMIDIGVHVLEMCHYTMGSPRPVAAVGMTDTYLGNKPSKRVASNWAGWDYKTYTVEDLAIGHIRFEDGAVIHVEASFAAHHEHNGTMDFQIMGTKGGAKWGASEVFTDQNGYMMNMTPAYVGNMKGFGTYFNLKLRDFVDHCLYDKPTIIAAEQGLMVQQMLDAIYESADKGGAEVLIK